MDSCKNRLRQLRGSMKQSELAEQLGISQNMVSNYENGREPPIDVIEKYAKLFNVSSDYIIGLTHEMRPDSTNVSNQFGTLAEIVGTNVKPVLKSDISLLLSSLIAYYKNGANAGDAPLNAIRQFIQIVPPLLNALTRNDTAATLEGVNNLATVALSANQILVDYLSSKKKNEEHE